MGSALDLQVLICGGNTIAFEEPDELISLKRASNTLGITGEFCKYYRQQLTYRPDVYIVPPPPLPSIEHTKGRVRYISKLAALKWKKDYLAWSEKYARKQSNLKKYNQRTSD